MNARTAARAAAEAAYDASEAAWDASDAAEAAVRDAQAALDAQEAAEAASAAWAAAADAWAAVETARTAEDAADAAEDAARAASYGAVWDAILGVEDAEEREALLETLHAEGFGGAEYEVTSPAAAAALVADRLDWLRDERNRQEEAAAADAAAD